MGPDLVMMMTIWLRKYFAVIVLWRQKGLTWLQEADEVDVGVCQSQQHWIVT